MESEQQRIHELRSKPSGPDAATRLAKLALIIPVAAAVSIVAVYFGARLDEWGLGGFLVFVFISNPLLVASPFSSLVGVLSSAYALQRTMDKLHTRRLLRINMAFLVVGTLAEIANLHDLDYFGVKARREREQYVATRTPEKHLSDAVSNPREFADIDKLAAQGVDLNTRGSSGQTPLILTVTSHNPLYEDVAKKLLALGADPEAKDVWGKTALHYACVNGQEDIVELLVKHGANTAALTDSGESCLDLISASTGYSEGQERIKDILKRAARERSP